MNLKRLRQDVNFIIVFIVAKFERKGLQLVRTV